MRITWSCPLTSLSLSKMNHFTVEDLLAEDEEQFELYFASNDTAIGVNATVCISIEDTDGMVIIATE